ncbi:MAG: hypothetical protein ACERKV_12760 [Clostridiaceae bacterium]
MNKQQREFKRQMRESLTEIKNNDKEKYNDLVKRNNLENVETREKREFKEKIVNIMTSPFKLIIRIVIFIFIISSLIGIFMRFTTSNNGLEISNSGISYSSGSTMNDEQQNIVNYVNTVDTYETDINKQIDKINADKESLKDGTITEGQCRDRLLAYQSYINESVANLDMVECPESAMNFKNLLMQKYKALDDLMTNEISYLNFGDKSYLDETQKNIDEYNAKGKEMDDEINNIKDEYNLK